MMKKIFLGVLLSSSLMGCDSLGTVINSPRSNQGGSYGVISASEAEKEYQMISKNYQEDPASVLTELLNDDESSPNAAIVIENGSACNIVITVSGKDYYKKVPIAVGKLRGILVKKGIYRLTGQVCNARYDQEKNANTSISLRISN